MRRYILLLSLIAASIAVSARNITIHVKDAPAEKTFSEIMRQSGKNFIYTASLLDGIKVTVNADNQPLGKVLTMMLSGTSIAYRMRGDNVILTRKKSAQPRKITVNGFVRETGSGEALIGAVVVDTISSTATATNSTGFFSMKVPLGKAALKVTYPGYIAYRTGRIDLRANTTLDMSLMPSKNMLSEVVVHGSRNRALAMESASVGSLNLSREYITSTPVMFGESDVVKSIQLEPGVSAGVEGMAGMYVHGGSSDENLYMLDNIPLYQINHFGGLFSAFNTEAIRNVDFYKSTFPARYDGRLSSFMDVHTRDGSLESHHGSAKLGLTSGAFSIEGPIVKGRTSYSLALRRSWYDVLTIPALAIINKVSDDETKTNFRYAFTDINAKITHHFSPRSRAYTMFYFGEDYLKVGEEYEYSRDPYFYTYPPVNIGEAGNSPGDTDTDSYRRDEEKNRLKWGNIVASAAWNYVISPSLYAEVTAAYTRYRSSMRHFNFWEEKYDDGKEIYTSDRLTSDNRINDWIFRADFDFRPTPAHNMTFGAYYIIHRFLPSSTRRTMATESLTTQLSDSTSDYHARELNLYVGDDWKAGDRWRINAGLHYSIFNIEGAVHSHLSPSLTLRYSPGDDWAIKAGYSRTVQYVHQLSQSSISLPTDQWVPIVAQQKPSTADKITIGAYHSINDTYTFSAEAYMKWMDNLLDYRDEYYLLPPETAWDARLTSGKGTAKGIDFKLSKEAGKFTGHISYSLLWADRRFAEKNAGQRFPARFDNRHKINILVNWKVNDRWDINASWTGMSGNRLTLPLQCWQDPMLAPWHYDMMLPERLNNFRLPFYHRLDLSFTRHTRHGYWNFSLYNAYCNMNVIAVRLDYSNTYDPSIPGHYRPVFQKIHLLPVIPSVSYTWLF